jgi:DNA (cytosine-5)-methyltransferase 1
MGTHADRLDTRSGLAYAFLDLVERHRPPAIVLENVPGLLSSNGGRDLGALLGRLGELGYWWAYRVLDARHFGVPQRRRRVFIVAIHARIDPSGDGPAEVLSVGSRCDRHPATGGEARAGAPGGAVPGVDIARTVVGTAGKRHDKDIDTLIAETVRSPRPRARKRRNGSLALVGASPDARRVRAADGLAGRLDDRAELDIAATLNSGGNDGGFRTEPGEHLTIGPFVKRGRAQTADDGETWGEGDVMPGADPLLPDGLDSHRYRCCGNGVVSDVAEWIGGRLALWLEGRL